MVETVLFRTSEHELVIFEQIITVFIDIDLKCGVERMYCKLIMIREGHDVISQLLISIICLLRSMVALVEDAFHLCVGVEVGTLPVLGQI